MFVVQRSFRRVRRSYDPDEVDRHLELGSQWFMSTEVGRAFAQQRMELRERERAVAASEAEQARESAGARLEAEATLEGARRRADAAALRVDGLSPRPASRRRRSEPTPSAIARSCSSGHGSRRPPPI